MKKVLAAVVAVLVLLGAGLYFFVARPLLRPSEVTAVAERALATDDLLLLAAVNVKQAVFLEKWLLGSPRATTVAATPPPAVADRSLLDHLRAAGVDPRHDVDHALYALYPADRPRSRGTPRSWSAGSTPPRSTPISPASSRRRRAPARARPPST